MLIFIYCHLLVVQFSYFSFYDMKASHYYWRAAVEGHKQAQYRCAKLLLTRSGYESEEKLNTAISLLQKAAAAGLTKVGILITSCFSLFFFLLCYNNWYCLYMILPTSFLCRHNYAWRLFTPGSQWEMAASLCTTCRWQHRAMWAPFSNLNACRLDVKGLRVLTFAEELASPIWKWWPASTWGLVRSHSTNA